MNVSATKGFTFSQPMIGTGGYSKALRTLNFKASLAKRTSNSEVKNEEVTKDQENRYKLNGLAQKDKVQAPVSKTQYIIKGGPQNGIRKVQVRSVLPNERSSSQAPKNILQSNIESNTKPNPIKKNELPLANRTQNDKNDGIRTLNNFENGKETYEASRTRKAAEKLKESSKLTNTQSKEEEKKGSVAGSHGSLNTPPGASHRSNYHGTNKVDKEYDKKNQEKTKQKETEEDLSKKATIQQKPNYASFSVKHETKEEKNSLMSNNSEKETQDSSPSDYISNKQNKPKIQETLNNITNQKSEETSKKNYNELKIQNESNSINTESKIRETKTSTHITIMSTVSPSASSEPKGLVGLRNIGNTCFMNSILQCLFNTPLFSDYFLRGNHRKEKNPKNKGLAEAFADLLEKMRSHSGSPSHSAESTYDVKNKIAKVNPIFSGYEQHDAQELLKAVLEGINDDLNRVVTKPAYKELTINPNKRIQDISDEWFEYMLGRDNSIVTDLFCGQLLSKTICTSCNYESLAFDNYWDLALSFGKGSISKTYLTEMMEQFLTEEDLDDLFHCEKCKTKRKSKKKFVLWRLPKILVIQLKRFEYSKWRREKINKSVAFPVNNFDLSQFVNESTDSSVRDSKYTLFGIVNHGGSLYGGHYTANSYSECMNPYNRKWYNFNDSSVSETYMKKDEAETKDPLMNKNNNLLSIKKQGLTKDLNFKEYVKERFSYGFLANFASTSYNWVELQIPKATLENKFKTRLMSFNILADCNIYPKLYPSVNPAHLNWEHREPLLIKLNFKRRITDLSPDIACIQEFEPLISDGLLKMMANSNYKELVLSLISKARVKLNKKDV